MIFGSKNARLLEAAREDVTTLERHERTTLAAFGDLTSEYTDLLMFAEAFAEELEGRRGQGRPIAEVLAEYREHYPFD